MRRRVLLVFGLLAIALLAVACGAGEPRPVPLVLDEDACSYCRMAISQRELAAEAVTPGGQVERFDDIGCLLDWRREREVPEGTVFFVVDFDTGDWVDATEAVYVRSRAIPTPMGSGLVAFGSRDAAAAASRRLGLSEGSSAAGADTILDWRDLTRERGS